MLYSDNGLTARLSRLTRGFLFIPLSLAISGAALAIATNMMGAPGKFLSELPYLGFLDIDADGARAVLSTVAGAMMSVISLVYSLTLVVFTLAAGNIAPRLLETFANNRVNQVTIGLLGATFLYSLICLYQVHEDTSARLAVAIAILLSATSVFWLIYFVNDVAGRIMVDNEIGRIQKSLRRAIDKVLSDEPRESADDEKAIPKTKGRPLTIDRSGYITAIDARSLARHAAACDGFVEVLVKPGHFVIADQPVARLYLPEPEEGERNRNPRGRDAEELSEAFCRNLRSAFITDYARAPDGDLQFAVHLSVEIALRALSPGVNDSYTAISAIDHLSASLSQILRRGAPSSLVLDEKKTPRVWLETLHLEDVLAAALNPLRQNACGNVLVTIRLLNAIARMSLVTRPEYRPLLQQHLANIVSDSRRKIDSRIDRQAVARAGHAARKAVSNRSAEDT